MMECTSDFEVFLTEWFAHCPKENYLEIRIKKSGVGYASSEFFPNIKDAMRYLGNLTKTEKQHVWFGVNPRRKLTEDERVAAFSLKYETKLKESESLYDKKSETFRKGLLEEYGELGGGKEYINSTFCRQFDFDCNKSDDKAGSSDEDYAKMKEWAGKLKILVDDSGGNGFIIGSGNGIQLFAFLKETKRFANEGERNIYESKIRSFAKQIMEICPDGLVQYDSTTAEIARVMRLPGFSNPKGGRKAEILFHIESKDNFELVNGNNLGLDGLLKAKIPDHGRYAMFVKILGHLANKQISKEKAREVLEKFNTENCKNSAPGYYIDNAMSSYEYWKARAKEECPAEIDDDAKVDYETLPSLIEKIIIYPYTDENVNEIVFTNGRGFKATTEKLMKVETWKIKIFDNCGKILSKRVWYELNPDTNRQHKCEEDWTGFLVSLQNTILKEVCELDELSEEHLIQDKIRNAITTFCKKISEEERNEAASLFVYWEDDGKLMIPTEAVKLILKKTDIDLTLGKLREALASVISGKSKVYRVRGKAERCWVFNKQKLMRE